jgi:hypothetical protein
VEHPAIGSDRPSTNDQIKIKTRKGREKEIEQTER